MAQFDASGLSNELESIGTLLPRQFLKKIYFFERVNLSNASLESIEAKKKYLEQNSSRAKIAKLQNDRDTLFFQSMEQAQKSVAIARKESEIRTEFKKLKDDANTTAAAPDEDFFLLELHKDHADGNLLPPVKSPLAASTLSMVDYLIYGKCWERNGYLGFTISVYNALSQKEIFTSTQYASLDDIDSSLDELVRPVAESILETQYSLVELSILPNDARVVVDGKETGSKTMLFFLNQKHTIEVSAPGFAPVKRDFTVTTGENATIEIALALGKTENIIIDSQPQGSRVYMNSEKIGITPVTIERSSQDTIVRIENEGFNTEQIVIGPSSAIPQGLIKMELNNGKSHEVNFNDAKDNFYRSLGFFIGVLPVSVFSYGTFKMYGQIGTKIASDYESGIISTADFNAASVEINPQYYASQTVFWAALGANILLAANAIFRLVLFIDSAN